MSLTELTTTELRRHLRATIRTCGERSVEAEILRRELSRRETPQQEHRRDG